MIAIKVMEMPKRCEECKFCLRQETNDYGSFGECLLQKDKRVNCLVWSRDDDCPLVEIVTCKDCKHWDKCSTPRVPDEKEYHYCPMEDFNTAEDYFCAYGERKA